MTPAEVAARASTLVVARDWYGVGPAMPDAARRLGWDVRYHPALATGTMLQFPELLRVVFHSAGDAVRLGWQAGRVRDDLTTGVDRVGPLALTALARRDAAAASIMSAAREYLSCLDYDYALAAFRHEVTLTYQLPLRRLAVQLGLPAAERASYTMTRAREVFAESWRAA